MLSKLKIVDVARSTAASDAAMRVRAKLVAALQEQKASVQAAIDGTRFTATRKVGGETRERRFRPWWFKNGNVYLTSVQYGTSPLPLPGGRSVEAGSTKEDLLTTYDLLVEAVQQGELDEVLLTAAARRGRKGKETPAEGNSTVQQPVRRTARRS
ncbi:hypothetical protein [Paracraurococcus lichenis]|uniref:HK97 gp10 family phage protein n=1 Tax=Paracraurococcus lichenis TaxID=3064888 RepID=A0ABT9E4D2_9PROT|nr:hypothetical protein [Paracraurococcus sp. LOR1-02]MDO9711032.1 hypothetical protein [Paracraurococcus sp. LOR1-02]